MIHGKKIVALCLSRINDAISHELVTTMNRLLTQNGYNLFVYATSSDLFWHTPSEIGEIRIFDLLDYNIIDTIIVFSEKIKSVYVTENIIEKAAEMNIPVISIGAAFENTINVCFNYENGFENVVRHVIEDHGCRKLHMIAGIKDNDFSEKRIDAFKRVLKDNSIPFDPSLISYGEFWSVPTEEAMDALLARNDLPEAIICANDIMAITVCNYLKHHGYTIPDDVIVTGFDGVEEIEFCVPQISSCKCSYTDISNICCDIIINNKFQKHNYEIIPRIMKSESCGCGNENPKNPSEYFNDLNNRFNRYQEEDKTLSEITATMQTCRTIEEASNVITHKIMYDMCCILNYDCIDNSVNPLIFDKPNSFNEKMFLFYDTDAPVPFIPRNFNLSEIAPNLPVLLEQCCPLIFMPLNFLNIPLGYVCFHFHSDDINNYYKMSQTINALNNAIGGFRNIRYQLYLSDQLEDMYRFDALTGLHNRISFNFEYNRMIRRISADERLTVILADLDGLKYINDTFGHGEGDNAIHTVANALSSSVPSDSICTRFGGDELIAVYAGVLDCNEIKSKIHSYLSEYTEKSGKLYEVAASVGVYVTQPNDSRDFEQLMKKSDSLMYIEKSQKKKLRHQ